MSLLILTGGCRDRSQPPSGRSPSVLDSPADSSSLRGGDFVGYAAGREEEISAMMAALAGGRTIGTASLDSVGARAAGLDIDAYRRLVERVERALRSPAGDSAGGDLDRERAALDSLRVERLVLAVRLGR